ncbi:MAG: hypothetical protein HY722_17160 [Planctomycetes bacterium]|nr:hypothetical protein [Planctomycetota bacterium]
MIGLHYQDERELAQALLSISRRCQPLGARFVFFGPAAVCREARAAVHHLERSVGCWTFRPLDSSRREPGGDAWSESIEIARSALPEASVAGGPIIAWIEAPVPEDSTPIRPALRACCDSLHATSASATVICGYRRADLSEAVRAGLLEVFGILINAKVLLPQCPAWIIDHVMRSQDDDHTPVAGVPASALAQMVAGVAHELGNPLSIISSSLQYLHQRFVAVNDPANDFTGTALANVERMNGLLRGMLDVAAVKKPRLEHADLSEIVSEVLRFTAAECARREVTVAVSFDPSLPRAWVDPRGIKQIILNIVKNALDAMTGGGRTLDVRTRMATGEQAGVIVIANDGPSIPPEVLPHLFRPFRTTKGGGTGLGLYLSRQIAKEHGGGLEVENRAAGGVQVTLTLPLDPWQEGDDGAHPDRRR